MTYRIERVTEQNASSYVEVQREFHELCKFVGMPFSQKNAEYIARNCYSGEMAFGEVVFGDDSAPCGGIGGWCGSFLSSSQLMGTIEGIYVRFGCAERPKIANEMLCHFRKWAAERGASALQAGVIAGFDNLGADIFYRRNGFVRTGIIYGQLIGDR